MTKENHYYIYFKRKTSDTHWTYERTTGAKWRAKQRCQELKDWYGYALATWTLNCIIPNSFY